MEDSGLDLESISSSIGDFSQRDLLNFAAHSYINATAALKELMEELGDRIRQLGSNSDDLAALSNSILFPKALEFTRKLAGLSLTSEPREIVQEYKSGKQEFIDGVASATSFIKALSRSNDDPEQLKNASYCMARRNIIVRHVLPMLELLAIETVYRDRADVKWHIFRKSAVKERLAVFCHAMNKYDIFRGRPERKYSIKVWVKDGGLSREAKMMICMPEEVRDCVRDLVANSRKYSEPGTCVEVAIKQYRDRLKIAVADHGCGISKDDAKRVLRPGVRGYGSRGRRALGPGVGLSKAMHMVNTLGGKMAIKSPLYSETENPGTRVLISIPLPELIPTKEYTCSNDLLFDPKVLASVISSRNASQFCLPDIDEGSEELDPRSESELAGTTNTATISSISQAD